MKKRTIFFGMTILLLFSGLMGTNAAVELNQVDDTAELGTNTGTLTSSSDIFTFSFEVTDPGYYVFSLYGPEGTDFDMEVVDSSGSVVADAFGTTYPDQAEAQLNAETYTIEVNSWSGSGDFELVISMESPPISVSYYDGLSAGDVITWDVSSTYDGTTETGTVEMEILEDSPTLDLTDSSPSPLFEITTSIDGETDTYTSTDAEFFLLPLTTTFENGTTLSLEDEVEAELDVDSGVTITDSEIRLELEEDFFGETLMFDVVWDRNTGILKEYTLSSGGDSSSITLNSAPVEIGGGGDEGVGLPFNFAYGLVLLLAIPMLRRFKH